MFKASAIQRRNTRWSTWTTKPNSIGYLNKLIRKQQRLLRRWTDLCTFDETNEIINEDNIQWQRRDISKDDHPFYTGFQQCSRQAQAKHRIQDGLLKQPNSIGYLNKLTIFKNRSVNNNGCYEDGLTFVPVMRRPMRSSKKTTSNDKGKTILKMDWNMKNVTLLSKVDKSMSLTLDNFGSRAEDGLEFEDGRPFIESW